MVRNYIESHLPSAHWSLDKVAYEIESVAIGFIKIISTLNKDKNANISIKQISNRYGVDIAKVMPTPEDDTLSEAMGSGANVLTPTSLRRMAKQFAEMPVTDAAIGELLALYYDVVEQTEAGIRESVILGNSAEGFIQRLSEMKSLMMLGWMKRMLKRSGEYARERGYKRIDIEQVVHLDAFQT